MCVTMEAGNTDNLANAGGEEVVRKTAPPPPPPVWRELLTLLIKIAAIALVFALLFTFMFGIVRSQEPSMIPSVKDGDVLIFYRLSSNYHAGDLILLTFDGSIQARRVVATAGDTVDITEDGLVINGALQQEPAIGVKTERYVEGVDFPLTVPEGHVFVLGDNRTNSTDSRIYGTVAVSKTLGTVITLVRRREL